MNSHSQFSKSVLFGAGVFATLALIGIISVIRQITNSAPRTSVGECHGSTVSGTISVHKDLVVAQVLVYDSRDRAWEVRFNRNGAVEPLLSSRGYSNIRDTTRVVGDSSEGTATTLYVRPSARSYSWCSISMRLRGLN